MFSISFGIVQSSDLTLDITWEMDR